jgi:SAM-dependent methyltransferase
MCGNLGPLPSVSDLTGGTDLTLSGTLEEARVKAFGERFLSALNEAAVIAMISLGHRTGLFDALSRTGSVTTHGLAAASGLQERYVREWLHALTVAKVVEIDEEGRFLLPPEHAAVLTRDGRENLAVFAQYLPLLGGVEDSIVDCFREGGGVPYERFGRFHQVMGEDSGQTVLAGLHEHILPLIPGAEAGLSRGIRVADFGCGRGLALIDLASRYPESEFTGFELSSHAVAFAEERVREQGVENVRFVEKDLSDFDETAEEEAYDLVFTFDAVHDQAKPAALLRGIARTLRTGGVYLMQDIHASTDVRGNMDHPMGPFLYSISVMHCMTVSLAQGGMGLGTMWGREQALTMLRDAGFGDVEIHRLDHDPQNDYYLIRKKVA